MTFPQVTDEQVAARVGSKEVTAAVSHARETAEGMVAGRLARTFRPVTDSDYVEAVLRVAYALYDGAKSSDGVRPQLTMDGATPVRAPRDPMTAAWPILARYTVPFG